MQALNAAVAPGASSTSGSPPTPPTPRPPAAPSRASSRTGRSGRARSASILSCWPAPGARARSPCGAISCRVPCWSTASPWATSRTMRPCWPRSPGIRPSAPLTAEAALPPPFHSRRQELDPGRVLPDRSLGVAGPPAAANSRSSSPKPVGGPFSDHDGDQIEGQRGTTRITKASTTHRCRCHEPGSTDRRRRRGRRQAPCARSRARGSTCRRCRAHRRPAARRNSRIFSDRPTIRSVSCTIGAEVAIRQASRVPAISRRMSSWSTQKFSSMQG